MTTSEKTHTEEAHLSKARQAYASNMLHRGKFRAFSLTKVPMLYFSGTRIVKLTDTECAAAVLYRWLNQNPFRSIYFAVQSMTAELTTAALAMMAVQGYSPSVAMIIVNLEAEFPKKATGKTTFTCAEGEKALEAVRRCVETGEATTAKLVTEGRLDDGTLVARFAFTWSFKQRSKK